MCPRVSVIIPTYNCKEYVCEAVDSVLNQSFKDFELIIVNDGSTDGTEQVLKKYFEGFSDKIKYIEQENKGISAARNIGIQTSSGEFIAFLDADDLWLPEKLATQIVVFDTNPNIGFVHTNTYGFGGLSGTYLNRYWMSPEQIKKHSGYIFFEHYFRNIRITVSTVMIRRECLDKVGIFDEYLSLLGCEDRDLFLRILWQFEAIYVDEPLAKYRDRTDSMGQDFGKMIIAQEYVYDKITKLYGLPNSYKKKALSSVYYEWASAFYSSLHIREGLKLQLKSIIYNPMNPYNYNLTRKMLKQLSIAFKDKIV